MIRVDIPDLQAHVPGVWKTLDAMILSTIRNLFPEWNLSGWNLFTVRSFFSSSSSSFSSRFRPSSHPLLQRRLDEDRPAFINHPLKRNPWRSIINDLATNFEEVPRPNETWPAECILHFEIRARLTRNRRPDSLTPIFFICCKRFVVVHLRMHFDFSRFDANIKGSSTIRLLLKEWCGILTIKAIYKC